MYATSLLIKVVPFGTLPSGAPEVLKDGVTRELGAKVVLGEELPLPASGYHANRRQYLAEAFLPLLRGLQENRDLVLAVTDVDLYTPGLNFVFGLADPRSQSAVISLTRLRPEFYGQPPDPQLFHLRVLKEAVHELGHLLGLGHCGRPACIMFFSNQLADTDRKGPGFCSECQDKLKI